MQQRPPAPARGAGAPEQHADDRQNHRWLAARGQQLGGEFPGHLKVSENPEQMPDALVEELPGMAGEAAAEETACEPTKSVPDSRAPEPGEQRSDKGRPQLVPPPRDPCRRREKRDGASQFCSAWPTPSDSRPDKNQRDKDRDGEQVRAAQSQPSGNSRHTN